MTGVIVVGVAPRMRDPGTPSVLVPADTQTCASSEDSLAVPGVTPSGSPAATSLTLFW